MKDVTLGGNEYQRYIGILLPSKQAKVRGLSENANPAMLVTEEGIIMLVRLLLENAFIPILVTEEGRVTLVR